MPVLVDRNQNTARDVAVKMCGLTRPSDIAAAAGAGANYVGFVFFEKSPRNITIETARALALEAPVGIAKVALTVNASDAELDAITQAVPLDMIQLHGRETPERVAEVKARYGLPVMKALGVADADDLAKIADFEPVVDQILLDAKPPTGADLPGGNGLSFDWTLISGRSWSVPWMLAGGLCAQNAALAVARTKARQLDVSSGIEESPGRKDPAKMRAFIGAVRSGQARA